MTIDTKHIDVDFEVIPQNQTTGLIEESDDEILMAAGEIGSFEESYPSLMVPRAQRQGLAEAAFGSTRDPERVPVRPLPPDRRRRLRAVRAQGAPLTAVPSAVPSASPRNTAARACGRAGMTSAGVRGYAARTDPSVEPAP